VTDLATDEPKRMSGEELLGKGLLVAMPERPQAAVLRYRLAGE